MITDITYIDMNDHYWIRKDGRVYSSRLRDYAAKDDREYIDWLAKGNTPTHFPKGPDREESEEELFHVLESHGVEKREAAGEGESRAARTVPDNRYLLNSSKTKYHAVSCPEAVSGSLRTLEEIMHISPDAKACAMCMPPEAEAANE